jgi:hypothetical protein
LHRILPDARRGALTLETDENSVGNLAPVAETRHIR